MLKDREKAKELYLQIKSQVENNMKYLIRKREEDPYRSILNRTAYHLLKAPLDRVPTFDPQIHSSLSYCFSDGKSFLFFHLCIISLYLYNAVERKFAEEYGIFMGSTHSRKRFVFLHVRYFPSLSFPSLPIKATCFCF